MNWLYWVLQFVGETAWPATVLIALLLFHKPIALIVANLRIVKNGEWEFHFGQAKEKAAEVYSRLPPPKASKLKTRDLGTTNLQNLYATFERGPSVTASGLEDILSKWTEIEEATRELASEVDSTTDWKSQPSESVVRFLEERHKIDQQTAVSLRGLAQLRNLSIHAPEGRLTTDRIGEFNSLADAVLYLLSTKKSSDE